MQERKLYHPSFISIRKTEKCVFVWQAVEHTARMYWTACTHSAAWNFFFFFLVLWCSREERILASSCPSVCLSICVLLYRRGSQWTDFWRNVTLRDLSRDSKIWLKSDKNIGHFTWRRALHCRWLQKFATKALLHNNKYFYTADSNTQHHNTHRMHSCFFIATMVTRTRHIVWVIPALLILLGVSFIILHVNAVTPTIWIQSTIHVTKFIRL